MLDFIQYVASIYILMCLTDSSHLRGHSTADGCHKVPDEGMRISLPSH